MAVMASGPDVPVDDDVVLAFVRRTTKASGVPEKLEDEATIEKVAHLLRGQS